jgi:hypothetical protein
MRKIFLSFGLIIIGFLASPVLAQSVGLDIHIGNRSTHPPPMVVGPPPIVLEAPPNMVYVESLRSYVAVGIPQDLFYDANSYYYHHNGIWYRSAYYRGPWTHMERGQIPSGLNGHRIEEIREYKRHAWEDHRGTGTRFREKHFRSEEHDERHRREIR